MTDSTSRYATAPRSPYENRRPHDALAEPTDAEKAEQERWAEIWEHGEDHDD
jgi:hypothetical protein